MVGHVLLLVMIENHIVYISAGYLIYSEISPVSKEWWHKICLKEGKRENRGKDSSHVGR
jgi:hypothetical protein